jgi:protocatechuate 3,4-dioxygenase beta subunit
LTGGGQADQALAKTKTRNRMAQTPPAYARHHDGGQPPYLYPDYASTVKRAPTRPLVRFEHTLSEITGPSFASGWAGPEATDLTKQHKGEPLGERMIVTGRILDEDGRPLPETLVELWQCNAAGRYHHPVDQHDAPLDPNFTGAGQAITDAEGRYRFVTIKPGAYPWRNSPNAWRPAHLHFGVFGGGFVTRLITQMYFPGDPLLQYDPIYQSTADAAARARLIAAYDPNLSEPEWALGYAFDMVLRGRDATPFEAA